MKNGMVKAMLILFVVVYCISPIDLAPGPVDDLVVILIGYLAQQMGISKYFSDQSEVSE